MQKPLPSLDGSLTNEPSDEELLWSGCEKKLLGEKFPYEAVLADYMEKNSEEGTFEGVDGPSSLVYVWTIDKVSFVYRKGILSSLLYMFFPHDACVLAKEDVSVFYAPMS